MEKSSDTAEISHFGIFRMKHWYFCYEDTFSFKLCITEYKSEVLTDLKQFGKEFSFTVNIRNFTFSFKLEWKQMLTSQILCTMKLLFFAQKGRCVLYLVVGDLGSRRRK